MKKTKKIVDRIGREITAGCYIAYGHALGRSAGLRLGRVEAVNEKRKKKPYSSVDDSPTLTVLGVDDDWKRKKTHLLEKRSTLLYPDRTIVLDTLPPDILKLYETDCVALGKKHTFVKEGLFWKKCSVCKWDDNCYN